MIFGPEAGHNYLNREYEPYLREIVLIANTEHQAYTIPTKYRTPVVDAVTISINSTMTGKQPDAFLAGIMIDFGHHYSPLFEVLVDDEIFDLKPFCQKWGIPDNLFPRYQVSYIVADTLCLRKID